MPRPSPFHILLTRDEQRELEARTRKYTSPYRDVIRAKIVLLAAQGLPNDIISARLDTPRQIASVITLNPAIRDQVKTGHRDWPKT